MFIIYLLLRQDSIAVTFFLITFGYRRSERQINKPSVNCVTPGFWLDVNATFFLSFFRSFLLPAAMFALTEKGQSNRGFLLNTRIYEQSGY
jgi:hypothetical protein